MEITTVINLLVAVGSFILSVVAFISARQRMGAAEKRAIEDRLAALEGKSAYSPTRDEHHQLTNALTDLGGQLNVLREQIRGLGSGIERIEHAQQRQESVLMEIGKR
jgi:hypothetical protein